MGTKHNTEQGERGALASAASVASEAAAVGRVADRERVRVNP